MERLKKKVQVKFEKEKYSDREYLFELQNFLDRLDNIEDEDLKLELIHKLHKIDNIISKISVNIITKESNKWI